MKVTGSSTVEYIEVEGHDYERTGCGTWTVRMGESMEPVYNPADLERQYHEIAKIALPSEFICFSEHWRLPRKYCKSEGDSYDVFVWSEGRWQFHDNVGEDTANEWYRNESESYVR